MGSSCRACPDCYQIVEFTEPDGWGVRNATCGCSLWTAYKSDDPADGPNVLVRIRRKPRFASGDWKPARLDFGERATERGADGEVVGG